MKCKCLKKLIKYLNEKSEKADSPAESSQYMNFAKIAKNFDKSEKEG